MGYFLEVIDMIKKNQKSRAGGLGPDCKGGGLVPGD